MRLLKLNLQDFQGLRSYSLTADGRNVSVKGTNGTGKTTIANSISWLLFDKPYTGEKNYSPKTTDEDGQELHHLDHRAEAIFEKDDGSRITLAKVFHEVWKKKRGSSAEEFSGHVTDTFIDGVPVSAGEYKRTIETLCPPDRAKVLTDPRHFAKGLHWEERRAILLEMCGDITDAEVVAATPDLAEIWDFLRKPGTMDQYYTVQEFGRIAASRKAELNRELTIIPARIDEAAKSIPDLDGLPPEGTIAEQLRALDEQKVALMGRAAAMTDDEGRQAIRLQLGELRIQILTAKNAYLDLWREKNRETNEAIETIGRTIAEAETEAMQAENRAYQLVEQITTMQQDREALLRRHAETKAKAWTGDTVCAACGQPLPEDNIEAAKAAFNQQRSRELADINEQGQRCSRAVIEAKQGDLDAARAAMERAHARRDEAKAAMETAKRALQFPPDFEETVEYAALAAQQAQLNAALQDGGNTMADRKAALQGELDAVTAEIRQAQEAQLTYVTARKRKERLAELETMEKDIAREYERFDRGVYLCEAFTRAKVAMLDERINRRFHAVRFRLFKQQINGGLQDCCDVLCPTSSGLTPYDSANNAAQVLAGAEIASALSRHWGVSLPLIIDNAESIVGEIPTDAQTIRLVVSEQDKRLRSEFDDERAEHLVVA